MNPINDWPLIGNHPSWCGGWFCEITELGHLHRSNPTHLQLGGDRWELTIQRADEPGPGETQICAVVTSGAFCHGPVEHVLALADTDGLIEVLTQITETARDDDAVPTLEVVR